MCPVSLIARVLRSSGAAAFAVIWPVESTKHGRCRLVNRQSFWAAASVRVLFY